MKKNLPWIYLVYNWDVLVACLTSAAAACAAVKSISRSWQSPFPSGAVKVVRVRPVSDLSGTDSEDLTAVILKVVYDMRKEAAEVTL